MANANYEDINSQFGLKDPSLERSQSLLFISDKPDSENTGIESEEQIPNVSNIRPQQINLIQCISSLTIEEENKQNLTQKKIKKNKFLQKKTERPNPKNEDADFLFLEISKIENNIRKINLNNKHILMGGGLESSFSTKKGKNKGFDIEDLISIRKAIIHFLTVIQLFIENIGVVTFKPIDLANILRKMKGIKYFVTLTMKEIFCLNKENKRIMEEAIPLDEVLFKYFLETKYEFLFYKYFINDHIFYINEKEESIQGFRTMKDIVEKMEIESLQYNEDNKEKNINKFIYSSFLVFNDFKKFKDKNQDDFKFCDDCPICTKNRIFYMMKKPYDYLEDLLISLKEKEGGQIPKGKEERIKYYLKLKKVIDQFENTSDVEINNEKDEEIEDFNYLGNNF